MQAIDRLTQYFVAKKDMKVLAASGSEVTPHGQNFDTNFDYPVVNLPELESIKHYTDRALVFSDGFGFQVLLMVDNSSSSLRKPLPPKSELVELAKNCHKYAGRLNGQQLMPIISLIELNNSNTEDMNALKPYSVRSIREKIIVTANSMNLQTRTLSSVGLLGKISGPRFMLKKALRSLDSSEKFEVKPEIELAVHNNYSVLTWSLVALLSLIFILEIGINRDLTDIRIETLINMGGLSSALVQSGGWFRYLSAGLLHGGFMHLILNCIALYFAGSLIEKLLGRAWMFNVFFFSLLGGSIASVAINQPNVVSVGASGAVMGLMACALIVSSRLPVSALKTQMQTRMAYSLGASILPILSSSSDGVDYGAHLGGAIAGLLITGAIYLIWKKDFSKIPLRKTARVLMALNVLVLAFAFTSALANAGENRASSSVSFISSEEIEQLRGQSDIRGPVDQLIVKYPEDPRSYFLKATLLIDAKDYVEAEKFALLAKEKYSATQDIFASTSLRSQLFSRLAEVQAVMGDRAAAIATLKEACTAIEPQDSEGVPPDILAEACGAP